MMEKMNKMSELLYYRWKKSYKVYATIYVVYVLIAGILVLNQRESMDWYRYEQYFNNRYAYVPFFLALAVLIGYGVISIVLMQRSVNYFERYMILPMNRLQVIYSEMIVNITMVIILCLLQYLVYCGGYHYFIGLRPDYVLRNGFYLSLARNHLMGYVLPATFMQVAILICTMSLLVCVVINLVVFYHNKSSYVFLLLSTIALYITWTQPYAISFSFPRLTQCLVLFGLVVAILYTLPKNMKNNSFGG